MKNCCDLIHKNKKEYLQWSLERFDNNLGHYNSNTCISCLGCNLQRRTDNHEYFKAGKQFSIKKNRYLKIIIICIFLFSNPCFFVI